MLAASYRSLLKACICLTNVPIFLQSSLLLSLERADKQLGALQCATSRSFVNIFGYVMLAFCKTREYVVSIAICVLYLRAAKKPSEMYMYAYTTDTPLCWLKWIGML